MKLLSCGLLGMKIRVHVSLVSTFTSKFVTTDGPSCRVDWICFYDILKFFIFVFVLSVAHKIIYRNSSLMTVSLKLQNILSHNVIISTIVWVLYSRKIFVRGNMSILKLVVDLLLLLIVPLKQRILMLLPHLLPYSVIIKGDSLLIISFHLCMIYKLLDVPRISLLRILVWNDSVLWAQAHCASYALIWVPLGSIQIVFDISVGNILNGIRLHSCPGSFQIWFVRNLTCIRLNILLWLLHQLSNKIVRLRL